MPFPLVAIDLPPETPAEYASALLDACRKAYIEGDCAANVAEPAPLQAEVEWKSETQAELFVKPEAWPEKQWLQRGLRFERADDPLERHRTLGYAIGSLAGTAAEILLRRDAQPAPTMEPPETSEPAEEPPPEPNPKAAPAAPPSLLPAPPVSSIPPPRADDLAPLQGAYAAGFFVGSGFEKARLGGGLGIQLIWQRHWTGQLWLSYSRERQTRAGISPSHLEGAVLLGHRLLLGPIATTLAAGVYLEHLSIPTTIGDASDPEYELNRTPRPFVGPRIGLLVNAASLPVSPFVDAAVNWQQAITVRAGDARDTLATRDPLQLRVVLGLSVHPNAWAD